MAFRVVRRRSVQSGCLPCVPRGVFEYVESYRVVVLHWNDRVTSFSKSARDRNRTAWWVGLVLPLCLATTRRRMDTISLSASYMSCGRSSSGWRRWKLSSGSEIPIGSHTDCAMIYGAVVSAWIAIRNMCDVDIVVIIRRSLFLPLHRC